MDKIEISNTPSQTVACLLGGQNASINIYQKDTGLYVDVLVDNALVIGGIIARNLNRIVRDGYLGFIGDLTFYDTTGTDDPSYPGLGTRYQLLYMSADDLGGRNS